MVKDTREVFFTTSGNRFADGIEVISNTGGNVLRRAYEFKRSGNWAESLYNSASNAAQTAFGKDVLRKAIEQAKDYTDNFKEVVYTVNGQQMKNGLEALFQNSGIVDMGKITFRVVP